MAELPYRVLAIDDDPAALRILGAVVKREGFDYRGFADWAAGMAALPDFDPDVICLDVQLPGATGFELCRRIKSNPDTRLIPILLITALNDRDSQIEGIEAGCDDFLSKPFDRVQLAARTRVLAQASRANRNLEDAERVLRSLAVSVEARDVETGNHCERVGVLAVKLAKRMDLPEQSSRALEQAGYLHDIGKIGIPDSILLKPGPLTSREWGIMRGHPAIGESIVDPLQTLREVLPIIRHHHERWDGTGYPDQLKGEEIPLEARVFQLADSFDALTSERPYHAAMTAQVALETIQEEAWGGKWDQAIVNVFADVVTNDLRSEEADTQSAASH